MTKKNSVRIAGGARMIPKFRAWDKSNSEMLKVECINWYLGEIACYPEDSFAFSMELKDVELMQYTGLKDKNGVEIYDGDIVHWKDLESVSEVPFDDFVKVEYSDEFMKWITCNKNDLQDDLYDFTDNRDLEVIGNIYENPELVEVE